MILPGRNCSGMWWTVFLLTSFVKILGRAGNAGLMDSCVLHPPPPQLPPPPQQDSSTIPGFAHQEILVLVSPHPYSSADPRACSGGRHHPGFVGICGWLGTSRMMIHREVSSNLLCFAKRGAQQHRRVTCLKPQREDK